MSIENETLLPVADAVEALTGRRPSRGTIWQWTRLSDNPRLETVVRFGRRLTSVAAVERFEVARGQQSPQRTGSPSLRGTAVPPQPAAGASK